LYIWRVLHCKNAGVGEMKHFAGDLEVTGEVRDRENDKV